MSRLLASFSTCSPRRAALAVALTLLSAMSGCAAPSQARRAQRTAPTSAPTAKASPSQRALDQMLNRSVTATKPQLPGYKLLRKAEDIVDRQKRILTVVRSRLRSARREGKLGRAACLERSVKQLSKLHEIAVIGTRAMMQALVARDRAEADSLWVQVSVTDMQARSHIYKECADKPHVEVQMIGPGGQVKYGSSSDDSTSKSR